MDACTRKRESGEEVEASWGLVESLEPRFGKIEKHVVIVMEGTKSLKQDQKMEKDRPIQKSIIMKKRSSSDRVCFDNSSGASFLTVYKSPLNSKGLYSNVKTVRIESNPDD